MDEPNEGMAAGVPDDPEPGELATGAPEGEQSQGAKPAVVEETAPPESEAIPPPSESLDALQETPFETPPEPFETLRSSGGGSSGRAEDFPSESKTTPLGLRRPHPSRGRLEACPPTSSTRPLAEDEPGPPEVGEVAPPESAAVSDRLDRIIESVLFAAGAPVSLRRLVEILHGPSSKEVLSAVRRLLQEYAPGRRGVQLREVAGGYQFRTARENAEWVRAVFRDRPSRLGRAALETLAIVTYKQPVTRAEIEAVRGVDVDGVLSTLLSRRLIKIAGRKEGVGRPLLYATTSEFLEVFGLKDLNELPSLKELGPAPETDDEGITPDTQPETVAADDTVEITAEVPAGSHGCGAVGEGGALAEDPQPGGDHVAAQSGGADPSGPGTPERPGGDRTGDEGGSAGGSDHD
jgi:segregation and condensation protein B